MAKTPAPPKPAASAPASSPAKATEPVPVAPPADTRLIGLPKLDDPNGPVGWIGWPNQYVLHHEANQ